MSASISEAFVVTNLPRLPPKEDVFQLCRTAHVRDAATNSFDLAISGSFLGTFISKPSPKMIWSHSISPQTAVECLDSFETAEGAKSFAIALFERNKSKLKFIAYGAAAPSQGEDTESSVVDEERMGDTASLPLLKEKLIPLKAKVINVRFCANTNFIYTLNERGDIAVWKFSLDEDNVDPVLELKNDAVSAPKILFNAFVKPEVLKLDSKSSKVEALLLTVEGTSSGPRVRIFSLKTTEILEIFATDIKMKPSPDLQFTFDPAGSLAVLNPRTQRISSVLLPSGSISHTDLAEVFKSEPTGAKMSIMAVSSNRLLVSKGSTLSLVDVKFNAILSILDLYPRSKEPGSLKSPKTLTILNAPVVGGNSIKSKVSFALVILKSERENYAQIQHVSVDTGLGKLSDALGKAIPSQAPTFVPFTQFMDEDNGAAVSSRMARKTDELAKAYADFEAIKAKGDVAALEKAVVAFLKCTSPKNINEFTVYEHESDRIVDPRFFKLVTRLLFDTNEGALALGENVPEMGIIYLLTHPLFPIEYTPGMLRVLEESPRLLRQAIVTCVNLPLGDLIEQLSVVEDDETFKDIVSRMITEFSTEEITQETVGLMKRRRSEQNPFDLDRIIARILRLNAGYEILNSFIDSNGLVLSLHYSNDASQLDRLITQTKTKAEDLLQDSQLATLVDLAISRAKKSRSSKKKKKRPDVFLDTSKAAMVLDVGAGTRGERPQASTYTVDRLAI